jgi:hypothetical protein
MLARRRWQSAKNNFRRGASPNDPGPWEDRLLTVPFTAQDTVRVTLTRQQQSVLKELARSLEAGTDAFTHKAKSPQLIAADPDAWNTEVNTRVTTMLKAAKELKRIASEGAR